MKLTLTEREREAYISGNTTLATEIAYHLGTVSALNDVLVYVRDIEETRETRHLFEALDDAENHLSKVIV